MEDEKKMNNQTTSVIGHFSGECADSTITNLNGLDITREVWETVFNSDEYKKALSNRWYIGYLGHPEDPNCMDFEHACITMTDCRIADNGKIYGEFDLIDTPVGKIVKAFIDSGVTFGISVRGAGDIVSNSVDPETFVFRGFDLVSFPAYPDAIPTFTQVAASSDVNIRKKYQSVCAAVKQNIDALDTVESLDILQSQFAKQSDEYKLLEKKKEELMCSQVVEDPSAEKISGLVELYVQAATELKQAKALNASLNKLMYEKSSSTRRKQKAMARILESQSAMSKDLQEKLENRSKFEDYIKSSFSDMKEKIKVLESENLKYRRKISASQSVERNKDQEISDLNARITETVNSMKSVEARTSNLDEKNKKLREELASVKASLRSYQEAYANMFATASGANLDSVRITSSTTVDELQRSILGAVSCEENVSGYVDIEDVVDDYSDESDIVTL